MTTYVSPAQPVNEALFALFQADAALQALAAGGAWADVPQNPSFNFLWFEVIEPQQFGGFGTKPGTHTLPELQIRLHVFAEDSAGAAGLAAAQQILARAIALIADPPTVDGYNTPAIFHDSTIPLHDEVLNNIKVKELVSQHRLYVEEQ